MRLTRVWHIALLVRPTARAMSWNPLLWAAVLAMAYVLKEATHGYVDYRILVLRVSALLICMGAAFALDDPTEDTLGHVPAPLVMRRVLRVALLIPFVAVVWMALVQIVGEVSVRDGGPLPVGDVTLEAATLLLISLSAACLSARLTSDRLGGIAAAPIVLALVAAALFLPYNYRLIVSLSDPRWADAHQTWRVVLAGAAIAFLYLNRSPGAYRTMSRLRALKPAARTI